MRGSIATRRLVVISGVLAATVAAVIPLTASADGSGTGFQALQPARLLDTRPGAATVDGIAASAGLPGPGATTILVVAGRGGVPASGVAAVVLNITAVNDVGGNGFVTVFPTGSAQPNASTLNVAPGRTVANEIITKVGDGGAVSIYTQTSTHLIADVVGWFPAASDVTALVPARLLDTRPGGTTIDGQSAGTGLPSAASTTALTVVGRGGVPSSGVGAVVLNITAVNSVGGNGFVTVFPTGSGQPNASTLNVAPGQTVANEIIIKVGSGGTVSIFTQASTDLVADVVGWFPTTSTDLTPLVPARLLDTRPGTATIDGAAAGAGLPGPGSTTVLAVTGRGGVPASGVGAVVLNITAVNEVGGNGFVTVYPTGSQQPNASTLNVFPGQTIANEIIAKVGSGGTVSIYTQASTHLIADIVGWFPGTTPPPDSTTTTTTTTTTSSTTVPGSDCPPGPTSPRTASDVIQAVYAYPSDGSVVAGREAAIAHEVAVMQGWYDGQACGNHPLFVRAGGSISIITVHLTQTAAALQTAADPESTMEPTIRAAAGVPAGAALAVVYEGKTNGGYCGRTGGDIVFIPMMNCLIYPITTSAWPFNMTYLLGHEVTHLLGAVPNCAPHAGNGGHVIDDNRDVLYQGPTPRDWDHLMLDPGHDDYYLAHKPACPGIEISPLLGTS
jgi:hypothetical protein